ncbi:MAG TPA: chemotaxis protein CheW [Sphingomonas sp.]|nr:chemotaxis protein CheW [Sphingomonas sp.]
MAALEIDELTQEFVAETREMLEGVGDHLLAWEGNPDDRATIDAVFRLVHTIKGSCGFVNQPRIGGLAHSAEEVLAAARDGARTPDRRLVSAMLALIDRIAQLVEGLETGEAPDLASDDALIAGLAATDAAPAAEVVPEAAPVTAPQASAPSTIRVPVTLLETIMGQVSDLVLARNDLARRVRDDTELTASLTPLTNVVGELRDSIGRARLQPIERLFRGLPRLVRDTAAVLSKDVALVIEGDDVEIDREMVEALKDPLTHIVRNAIDHGIENDRRKAGKPTRATLSVTARQSGNQVTIAIADDGRGIDVSRLVDKAQMLGIEPPLGDAANLIFEPGFSTAAQVSNVSGRGVGMDVVRSNIEGIGGSVSLDNRPGEGLSVLIRVPLTLSILTCLIVRVGDQRFAIPRAAIDEVVAIGSDSVRYEAIGDSHIASLRGNLLSVAPLAALLKLPERPPSRLVIIESAGARFALPVDAALEHEELVARPLAPGAAGQLFAGQSLSDDGQPLLLLDALGVAAAAGIARGERRTVTQDAIAPRRPSALQFERLDGSIGSVRAAHVARIEELPREAFVTAGDEAFATIDGALFPARIDGPLPESGRVVTLRLNTPTGPVAWPVAAVRDLAPIDTVTRIDGEGYEGLILIEGQGVPLLEPVMPAHRRFAA